MPMHLDLRDATVELDLGAAHWSAAIVGSVTYTIAGDTVTITGIYGVDGKPLPGPVTHWLSKLGDGGFWRAIEAECQRHWAERDRPNRPVRSASPPLLHQTRTLAEYRAGWWICAECGRKHPPSTLACVHPNGGTAA